MQAEMLLMRVCGFDDDGLRVRVYFDEPTPLLTLGREHGVRSDVFRDLGGPETAEFRHYLGCHGWWESLRVRPAPGGQA